MNTGPVCIWCEGSGKVERFVPHLRRRAVVACERCDGQGRTAELSTSGDAA